VPWEELLNNEFMTLFEKIVRREIPADIVYEEDDFLVIRDINPQAPVHVLMIPKKPIVRVGEASSEDAAVLGKMLASSGKLARQLGVYESGYRLVINHGPDAGETVPHLHIHLLGKRTLAWPPG
jgi:histidine triad (HIT) family protein